MCVQIKKALRGFYSPDCQFPYLVLAQEPVVFWRVLRRKLGSSAGGDSLRFFVDFLRPGGRAGEVRTARSNFLPPQQVLRPFLGKVLAKIPCVI